MARPYGDGIIDRLHSITTVLNGSSGAGGYETRERERILVSNGVRTTEFITSMGDDMVPLQQTELRLAA